jgi:hypothetical protein
MPQNSGASLRLLVGPSQEGLWIVRDVDGVCGALFRRREDALHFAAQECQAASPAPAEWRLVGALDAATLFAPPLAEPARAEPQNRAHRPAQFR